MAVSGIGWYLKPYNYNGGMVFLGQRKSTTIQHFFLITTKNSKEKMLQTISWGQQEVNKSRQNMESSQNLEKQMYEGEQKSTEPQGCVWQYPLIVHF